ncbi:DUF5309 family protein [Campylobacter concisus]|uniref:SU10 major capsid protein n=1 Tax=Campylobacter concisus TaxID=199 RepID=UPI00122D0D3B|nr:DUF5309 family protein [Campylobacter concisus]
MAITTTGFQAPATKREGLKPSVYEKIILIGADETPMLSLIGTSSVKGIEHSSLTDSLAAPKKNAQLEISDFDDQIKSSVQKTSNAVQIFTSNVSVSRSMQAVATYGGKELERETAKRAKEHKLDMEYAIFGLGRDADVKNLSDKFTSKFLIGLENGKSITTKEIYNITYLENDLKFKELSSKDRLYKKVDTRV